MTTNVVVLLLPFNHAGLLGDGSIYMESPLHQCGVIDIDATVDRTVPSYRVCLLSNHHALSGCDTVASYYGMIKGKVLKVLRGSSTHLAVNFCLY